ncbi:MAG: glycosyltransferase family 4 protein [Gammaproteobacteria bacterium]
MRILFLSDNFPPEGNAPATRVYEHAVHWVRDGHQVTVLTGAPNFPEGKLFPGYRNRWYGVEEMEGIRVVRVKTYITANEGFLKRTLDYMSFMVSALIAGCFQQRPDVVASTSPQFFAALGGWLLAAVRWRPFVFEVRDLWPASIVAVGAMKDSLVVRWLEKLELFLYRRAEAVVTVTEAFKRDLTRRGITEDKIAVVMNGIESARYVSPTKDKALALQYGLTNKFVVGYIGTHGMAHALHHVLEAAELLREREDIVFLFVGGGAAREALVKTAKQRGLRNVRLVSRQPKEAMPKFLGLCDVALIHLKDDPLFESVIPSKIFEAMGMGLPILLALPEGEAAALVRNTGTGVVIPPAQPARLAEAVLQFRDQPALRAQLSRAGQRMAPRYSRKRQAAKMLVVFRAAIEGRGSVEELVPELAAVGPKVEQPVPVAMGAVQQAPSRSQQRQDYLTRLLVSATYGAFEQQDATLPRPLIPGVQQLIRQLIGADQRSAINSECRVLSEAIGPRRDRELWRTVWQRKAESRGLSVILVRLLFTFVEAEPRQRFSEIMSGVGENELHKLGANDVFDKLFQCWFQPMRERLDSIDFRQQLDQQLGYQVSNRARRMLEGYSFA